MPGLRPNLPGAKLCESFGTYFTYNTDEYTDEQVYILEEMKKIAMDAYDFEEIYDRRYEYKSEVVKFWESRLRSLTSPASLAIRDKNRHKQIYITEDILYKIRMGLMELVWDQAGEILIANEVVKLETIDLAEWADRLYCAAKRVEGDAILRKTQKTQIII